VDDDSRIKLKHGDDSPKITLDELVIDVSAFLYFLNEHYDGDKNRELPSFWMLIPKSLDVEWREGVNDFFIEKEVFSRKLLIVAKPVSDSEKERRRAELLMMFHSAISGDQTKQILLLLTHLHPESRKTMIEDFKRFKSSFDTGSR